MSATQCHPSRPDRNQMSANHAMNRSRGVVAFDNGKSIAATRLSPPFVLQSSMHAENPYAPPTATNRGVNDAVDAHWYLTRIQKYFRRMGIGGLVYIGVVIVLHITTQLRRGSFRITETAGPLVWCALLAWLFITMIRIGRLPEDQFPKHYRKARWIAILAGTLFLPILGLPAFISLRRLSLYSELLKTNTT